MASIENEHIQEGLRTRAFTSYLPKSSSKEEIFNCLNSLAYPGNQPTASLKGAVLNLPTVEKCWVRWIFSTSIYKNLWEGLPNIDMGEEAAEHLVNFAKTMQECDHIYIHRRDKIGRQILPLRGNVALIDNASRHANVIWFDDGKKDSMEELAKIIDIIGLEKMTVEYNY